MLCSQVFVSTRFSPAFYLVMLEGRTHLLLSTSNPASHAVLNGTSLGDSVEGLAEKAAAQGAQAAPAPPAAATADLIDRAWAEEVLQQREAALRQQHQQEMDAIKALLDGTGTQAADDNASTVSADDLGDLGSWDEAQKSKVLEHRKAAAEAAQCKIRKRVHAAISAPRHKTVHKPAFAKDKTAGGG